MTDRAENLLGEALRLSDAERAELATRLIQSLDPERDSDVDAAWAAEIERRCAALDSGEAVTSDWTEVRERIERDIFGR
ncbi:MAG: addiction module protein [Thermoanaerobaculia bacterium]